MIQESDLLSLKAELAKRNWTFNYEILDNNRVFIIGLKTPRIEVGYLAEVHDFPLPTFSMDDYPNISSFLERVEEEERRAYFDSYIGDVIMEGFLKAESDVYEQFKQLDKKGLDFPKEMTLTAELKFGKR